MKIFELVIFHTNWIQSRQNNPHKNSVEKYWSIEVSIPTNKIEMRGYFFILQEIF